MEVEETKFLTKYNNMKKNIKKFLIFISIYFFSLHQLNLQ